LSAFATAPTGDQEQLSGYGGATAGGRLALDWMTGPFLLTVNTGATYRPETTYLGRTTGSVFEAGLQTHVNLYRNYISLFANARTELDLAGDDSTTPVEVLGGIDARAYGVRLTVGAGGGLTDAVGSGAFRVVAMLGYEVSLPADRDGDGIMDANDQCVSLPEDMDGFEDSDGCPESDNDGDGVADAVDKCPNDAEDKDGFEDNDGCPETDNDGDGIADALDKCPNEAEDKDGFQDDDGCADNDNDGDGVVDSLDKCPKRAETINGFRDSDGCPDEKPRYVFEKKGEPIVFYDIVFQSGSAKLLATSFPVLDEIFESLQAQPNVKVRIEGHTDARGDDNKNLILSQQRGLSVLNYLVNKGVDKTRLEYEGYGETRPIGDNKTRDGRQKNRRVEFHVISD
ncbi:MAG: outer membrane protein OmpA-like peptidoglycan-associated protein, partial [Myxococcota bacterium]